jgi:hypothetical protein
VLSAAEIVEAQGLLQHVQQLLGQDGDPQVKMIAGYMKR